MELSRNQERSIRLALDKTIPTLFITGPGGTGKSEIIKRLTAKLNPDNYVLLAPTQSAALNVGGETIHSFFKIKPTINIEADKEEDVISFCLDEVDPENANGKTVIIDEASMLGEKMLTGILSRIEPAKLILFGDPEQLKPIKDNPVDWSAFCEITVHLDHNYRVHNEDLRKIMDHFRATNELLPMVTMVEDIKELKYDPKATYIAHTNQALSRMQKHFIGYSHAKVGDTLLTFGGCDETIQRKIIIRGETKSTRYFNNNDLVVVTSVPRLIDEGLWQCEVITLHDQENGTDSISINKYNKTPHVIVGSYNNYNRVLKARFKRAQEYQADMKKKYNTQSTAAMKNMITSVEDKELRKRWVEYFNLKNSPYARHHQFRTTYKAQGKAFDTVVIDWNDLPSKDHKEVAMGRAINNLTLIDI